MTEFVAYHGVSASEHQRRVDELAPQGFRPTSLSVSGAPQDSRYAAVWLRRPGPAWRAVHGVSAAEYQAKFDEFAGQGYAPVIVDAPGPANSAIFAALFEHGGVRPWFARHALRWDPESDPDTIVHENARAFRDGYIPHCLCVYGDPEDRRFVGVWIKNDSPTPWSWWFADVVTHQSIFEAETQAGLRPSWVSVAPDGWQLSVFRDDRIGEWWTRHGLTANEYQSEFDTRVAAGLMPIFVQAGGAGDQTRYSCLFAQSDSPQPKRLTITGYASPAFAGLDVVVVDFMKAHAIRAGSLTLLRRGEPLLNRGYSWSEDVAAITQPDTPFRIASLSKIFTAAAIDRLVSTGRLAWTTPAYPRLGITGAMLPDQRVDPSVDAITIDQLVRHRSGLNHARVIESGVTRQFEPTDDLRTIAARLGRTATPSRDDLVRYMHGEQPDFAPGSQESYSNFGYILLTSIVEAVAGRPYLDFVRAELLAPLGISEVWLGATPIGGRLAGEMFYDHPGIGLSVLQPASTARLPNAYGGVVALEFGEGTGSLVSTSGAIARFITRHAVWGAGGRGANGRSPGWPPPRRYGILDGTMSGASSRADDFDFAYVFTRRVTGEEQNGFTDAIDVFLNKAA